MTNLIQEIIADVIRERDIDTRLCHASVATAPGAAGPIVVECSDDEVAVALRRRFSERGEMAGVRVEMLPGAGMPEWMLVVSAVADVRRHPSHPSELVSQAIQGDAVQPLKTVDDWTLVRMDDGYIGWIRDWHLKPWSKGERDEFVQAATHRVRTNHAPVVSAPGAGATPLAELVVGTPVVAGEASRRGWLEVRLADGRRGFAPRASLEKLRARRPNPARLAETGLRFLGIPYLWGGNTPNGFDCSGVVQRVFRLNGLLLPRDSDQQSRVGLERTISGPSDVAPGNLLFFGKSRNSITHVGLVLPDRSFLHSYGQVIVNSLDPSSPLYHPRLASIWQITRDPLRKPTPVRRSKPVQKK
jgi:cell wall-associated NlpC family hydrolase